MLKLLLSYMLHSSILLTIVYLIVRFKLVKSEYLKDSLLKLALVGAFFSVGASYVTPSFKAISVNKPTSIQTPVFVQPIAAKKKLLINTPSVNDSANTKTLSPSNATAQTDNIENLGASKTEPQFFSFVSFLRLLTALYLAIVAVLVTRIILSWLELNRALKTRTTLTNSELHNLLEDLKLKAKYKGKVALSYSSQINSPIALANNEICIPERVLKLKPEQQEPMLAHELGHIIRKDPAWLIASIIIETIFFFQPLNRLIGKQLQQSSDIICDDFAIKQSQDNISLAKCLTTVAAWQINDRKLNLVSSMTNGSNLKSRISRILSGSLLKPTSNIKRLALSSALFLLIIALVPKLEVIAQNSSEIQNVADIRQIWISTVGDLPAEFNEDYSELISLPEGTKFIIEERFQNRSKKLVIREESGQKQYEYFVDGELTSIDNSVIEWNHELLKEWARAWTRTTQIDFAKRDFSKPIGFLLESGNSLIYRKSLDHISPYPKNINFFSEDKKTFYSTSFVGQAGLGPISPINVSLSPAKRVRGIYPNISSSTNPSEYPLRKLLFAQHVISHGKTPENENLVSIHTAVEIEELINNFEITKPMLEILYSIANDISSERHRNKAYEILAQVIPVDTIVSKEENQKETTLNQLSYSDFLIWENWLQNTNLTHSRSSFTREFNSLVGYPEIAEFFISIKNEPSLIITDDLPASDKQGLLDFFFSYNLDTIKDFEDEQTKAGVLKLLAEKINFSKDSNFSVDKAVQDYLEIANTIQNQKLKQEAISALNN